MDGSAEMKFPAGFISQFANNVTPVVTPILFGLHHQYV